MTLFSVKTAVIVAILVALVAVLRQQKWSEDVRVTYTKDVILHSRATNLVKQKQVSGAEAAEEKRKAEERADMRRKAKCKNETEFIVRVHACVKRYLSILLTCVRSSVALDQREDSMGEWKSDLFSAMKRDDLPSFNHLLHECLSNKDKQDQQVKDRTK